MRASILACFVILALVSPSLAETLPVTIWQKEKRWELSQGDSLKLQRGPFHLVLPLADGQPVSLVAAQGRNQKEKGLFDPGHGMAGPYDGLYLTWEGFHYFFIDPENENSRMNLWDRRNGLYYWKCPQLFDNTGSGAKSLPWKEVEPLTLIFRKDGYEDLRVELRWQD